MADIFISYKREDKEKAALLANRLISSGWSVWWDHDLLGGEDYDVVIERELGDAKAVIVIWSALSKQSRPVKDEANKALKRNVLVPVSFDNTEPPIGFGMTHTVIFRNSNQVSEEEYKKLYDSIKKKVGEPAGPVTHYQPPAIKKNKTAWIVLSVLILGVIIFLVVSNSGQRDTSNAKDISTHTDSPVVVKPTIDSIENSQKVLTEDEEVALFFKDKRPLEKTLPGDTIIHYTIKEVTNNSITLNVDYSYNTQHGNQVSLGAWLWKSSDGGGYRPVMLPSPQGSAEITITLSDLRQPVNSEGILLFMAESYKGPFAYRVYHYPHTWNP